MRLDNLNGYQIRVDKEGRLWKVSDNKTNIVGVGITHEAAIDCYHRGMDLLQQEDCGINTGYDVQWLEDRKE